MNFLRKIHEDLRESIWFLPSMMTLGAAILATGLLKLDRHIDPVNWPSFTWVFTGSPEGARGVLGVIAGSMITVAGVTFSILVVALSLASQQYGPRLLRNFLRDGTVHFVFGTFVSTFVYCLLVLLSVHGENGLAGNTFVPNISVGIAVLLACMNVFVLIYFINHVARSITASRLVELTSKELQSTIKRMFPDSVGDDEPPAQAEDEFARIAAASAQPVLFNASGGGYVQFIDPEKLLYTARRNGLVIEALVRPGDFVIAGDCLARFWYPTDGLPERGFSEQHIRKCFTLGESRSLIQDVPHGVDMLIEVTLRALSPSMNDPFTAIQCLDRLREVGS